MHNVRIGVRQTLPADYNSQRISLDEECGYIDDAVVASATVRCPAGISGKYLTIFIDDDDDSEFLTMCEVTITGII